jgi:lipoprotein signal peptidase
LRRRPFLATALIAVVVALVDIVIKLCALTLLGDRRVEITSWLGFDVHLNEQMAWGLVVGAPPALVTFAATAAIVAMAALVVPELARVDRWAPVALGFLAGAGIANAGDGLIPPRGAVDFIVIAHSGMETALNSADLAVLFGLALCCRTLVVLGVAIDRERQPRPRPAMVSELVVAIPMHAEPARADRPAPRGDRPADRHVVIRPDDIAPRA